jgi:hypothetical protein
MAPTLRTSIGPDESIAEMLEAEMYRFVGRLSVSIALTLGLSTPTMAQSELGSITGTLKDPQGGVLPGVTATAVNVNTNVTTTVVTNASGVYVLSSLLTGKYRVTFNLSTAAVEL